MGKQRVCVRARTLMRALFYVRARKHKKKILCSHTPIHICIHMTPLSRTRRSQQFRTLSFRLMSAPAASSAVTTSMWPLKAARWRAVRPNCKQQAAREGKQECVRVCARVCVCVCVCVCVRACVHVYLYLYLNISTSVCLSIGLSICLSIHRSIHLSFYLSAYLSISIRLSIKQVCVFVCVYIDI